MAAAAGIIGGNGCSSSSSSSWFKLRDRQRKKKIANRVMFCSASSVIDPYKTLKIQPGASESDVKKAFRQLALQYHPDVCRGSNCGVQFHKINEAYDVVMSNLREESSVSKMYESYYEEEDIDVDEPMRGMDDPDWDLWEEWMGWEGAGIRDYSSHINPYI
ncbi:chaperone protein dnaJ 8, chloroplastic [Quercus suber]|uniref:Chaperone protein dnaj 8 n=1 Tax=Quercus suber TaxID=58331 RepID=A0AAW0L0X3_QUESU|nr:chaperone protein dnaJ 8, chloroplastic [Quercus suber]POE70776.1 chaperone protein dnaj 8, chloroplastic [Quercus suber]